MKKIFFILAILQSSVTFAKSYGEFSCLEPQYAYINGILNEKKTDAEASSRHLQKKLELKNVKIIFNKSHGPIIDLLRSVFQKIDESNRDVFFTSKQNITLMFLKRFFGNVIDVNNISKYSDSDLTKLLLTDNQKNIDQLIIEAKSPDKKLIIFSHSQGNLYANRACERLTRDFFENIQIATPASEILCGEKNHYTSIHSDEMIQLLRKVGFPLGFFAGTIIKPPLVSNTPQTINPKYFESSILSNLPLIIPEVDSSNFIKLLGEDFDKKFQIHSIDNYLNNPPSLNKIKQHL